jgi:spore maturation protein CgeB
VKIFYAGCEYDHFDPKRGLSFEYENFYQSLKDIPGAEVSYFPFEEILRVGRKKFNDGILAAVRRERPDLVFFSPYSDELDVGVLEQLKKETTTIAWFADDSWRFYNYSKHWAKHFSWAVTTYSYMPPLYARAGQPNVVRSQWAANIKAFMPADPTSDFAKAGVRPDVSFVGGWSRPRARMMAYLESRGIKVVAYGSGWGQAGRISAEERNAIFSFSKINLALNPAPGFWNKNSLGRLAARASLNHIVPDFHLVSNVRSWLHRGVPQIKARHFEIPACGGFMMTGAADDLQNFYGLGKEIVIYDSLDDLTKKIQYYLMPDHEAERAAMARAGYERTIREHTYPQRFKEIFDRIGLKFHS